MSLHPHSIMRCAAAVAASAALAFGLGPRARAESPKPGKDAKPVPASKPAAAAKNPKVLVTIAKETTYITEPLRPDGYPDYIGAVNRRYSRGVTPGNNFAALFQKAVGPESIPTALRKKYYEMLGIPLPAAGGQYFVSSTGFVEREKQAGTLSINDADMPALWEKLSALQSRPWSKDAFPLWAEWLAANEKPLTVLTEAAKRPRRYDPLLCEPGHDLLVATVLPAVQQSRDVARALAARAMLRLDGGDLDGAWQDLMTCRRIARLERQGTMLVEQLVGITIDGIADLGEAALLGHPKLTASRIARMRAELAKLPPAPRMVECFDLNERLICLDATCSVPREGLSAVSRLTSGKDPVDPLVDLIGKVAVDWDVVLRIVNSWYDRAAAVARTPTRSKRLEAQATFGKELNAMAKRTKDVNSLSLMLLIDPRGEASRRMGQTLVCLLLPATQAACEAEDRWTTQRQIHELAFALAAYHADHQAYPEKLGDLMPKYVAAIPKDMFAEDDELQYVREPGGYRLYSVGPNGKDDEGRGWADREKDPNGSSDWDDIGVRIGEEEEK